MLWRPTTTVSQGIVLLGQVATGFRAHYEAAVDEVLSLKRPLTLCTVYNGHFPPPHDEVITSALGVFNDVIYRVANARGLKVIDLRDVCSRPEDFANPIEPSGPGGLKIAQAIARTCGTHRGCPRPGE